MGVVPLEENTCIRKKEKEEKSHGSYSVCKIFFGEANPVRPESPSSYCLMVLSVPGRRLDVRQTFIQLFQ